MSYCSDSDSDYTSRPYPRTCFIHAWGWEVIECGQSRFRLLTEAGKCVGTFATKAAAIDYINAEFL